MIEHVRVSQEDCIGCCLCAELCPTSPTVFEMRDITAFVVHAETCEDCMLCTENCPTNAITIEKGGDADDLATPEALE